MGYSVGIVGASGAVGQEILKVLEKSPLETANLRLFGSARSAGTKVESSKFGSLTIELFEQKVACECDVIFLAVSGSFALEHGPAIADSGSVVIDNSSAFRYDPNIPLVVPEINGEKTKEAKLIANPNCTTAIAVMAVYPLLQTFGIKRLLVSTYQAASGAGQPGMEELVEGIKYQLSEGKPPENKVFSHPLPFNVIPHIDKFQDNGYTKEEMKVTWETRKICGLDENIPISCSAVRIPTLRAHSEVIVMETEESIDIDKAREVLEKAPGIDVVDNPEENKYPMPMTATGKYNVQVGRLRSALAFQNGIEFFICGDQLLRGAALNAVLIAETMQANGSLGKK